MDVETSSHIAGQRPAQPRDKSPLCPFSSPSPHGSTHTVPSNLPDHITSCLILLFFLCSLCFSCNTKAISRSSPLQSL
ncbi:hypothetical protein CRG98_029501 [Punica granatum]|uniref:Uncharacterized protein n=1 Tax=Punica granatum TaxID=22663 RepID=A0A2I0J1J0_PUNGR|nr:hypothetical protein CRG98_029501 [Punica granatum]